MTPREGRGGGGAQAVLVASEFGDMTAVAIKRRV